MTTATVGVCGQASWLRPCSRSRVNFIPNGSVRPPVIAPAIAAAAQIRPDTATADQQEISTAQPAAAPPEAADWPGPSARLTAGSPRSRGGWPGWWREVPGVRD